MCDMATASLLECAKRQPKPKTLSRKYQYLIFSRAVEKIAGQRVVNQANQFLLHRRIGP
jgi:hypothetical protein